MRPFINLTVKTIPTQDPALRHLIQISEPTAKAADRIHATATDGKLGHVVAIAWSVDHKRVGDILAVGRPECVGFCPGDLPEFFDHEACAGGNQYRAHASIFETERDWLDTAFRTMELDVAEASRREPVIVGHHVAEFDIPVLTARAAVLGVRLPIWWPVSPVTPDDPDWISFGEICRASAMPCKTAIGAGIVYDMWRQGRKSLIEEHCLKRVSKISEIHRQIMIAFGEIKGVDMSRSDAPVLQIAEAA